MKYLFYSLAVGVALSIAPLSRAQTGVQVLEQQVARQEQQVADITSAMLDVDKDIEGQVDKIVSYLASVKDSTDSKTKVINLQEDVIVALKKSIDFYQQQRNARLAGMNRAYTPLSKEDLAKDVGALDSRVNKRVDQIVELTKSLTEDQGFERYDYNNSYYGGSRTESDAYRQNKRVSSKTANDQEKVMAGLQKSIDDLKRENVSLNQTIAYKQSESEKQLLRDQIQKNEATIEARRQQMAEVVQSDSGGEKKVGSKEATNLKQILADRKADIKKDFNELVRLNGERDNARVKLNNLKAQLDAAKAAP